MAIPNIHILGIQGSGKGTQSILLEEKYQLTHASSGDLFRSQAISDPSFNQKLQKGIAEGHLMSDQYLLKVVRDFLSKTAITSGFLGDGVIRTASQYRGLKPIWKEFNFADPILISLTLPEEIALERIEQRTKNLDLIKRADDNPTAIARRFMLFHTKTKPVIELFRKNDACIELSANQSIETIHDQISEFIEFHYPDLSHVTH